MSDNNRPDDELRALYRDLPREEPPPAIDAAVLAFANLSVSKRPQNWKVPVSLVAVLVLSVVVTLRVTDEQPEIQAIRPAPPVTLQIPQSPPAKPKAASDAPPAGPASPQPGLQAKPQPRPEAAPPRAIRRSEAPQREIARPEPPPPAKEETVIAAAPSLAPPEQADAAAQSAGRLAGAGARAEQRAPMAAKSRADATSLASAAPLAPEAWVERIIELRASARHKEADESYEEFRRRYPDYVVPPEKLQKLAPPR